MQGLSGHWQGLEMEEGRKRTGLGEERGGKKEEEEEGTRDNEEQLGHL